MVHTDYYTAPQLALTIQYIYPEFSFFAVKLFLIIIIFLLDVTYNIFITPNFDFFLKYFR